MKINKLLLIVSVSIASIACSNNTQNEYTEEEAANIEIVKEYTKAMNEVDYEKFKEIITCCIVIKRAHTMKTKLTYKLFLSLSILRLIAFTVKHTHTHTHTHTNPSIPKPVTRNTKQLHNIQSNIINDLTIYRMKIFIPFFLLLFISFQSCKQKLEVPPESHPDISDWQDLFNNDLSNANFPEGVWTFNEGILTASEDQAIWTEYDYDNFILDLEFKTDTSTNSGVILYCTDIYNWIPNSVEIQIADDYSEKWADSPSTWQCGAVFGHLAPTRSMVEYPGEWNRFTITCLDNLIYVMLNGEQIIEMDMKLWTNAEKNPDGSEIPTWLFNPLSELPTHGQIGLQGKHAGAPIYFRNLKIKELHSAEDIVILPGVGK